MRIFTTIALLIGITYGTIYMSADKNSTELTNKLSDRQQRVEQIYNDMN